MVWYRCRPPVVGRCRSQRLGFRIAVAGFRASDFVVLGLGFQTTGAAPEAWDAAEGAGAAAFCSDPICIHFEYLVRVFFFESRVSGSKHAEAAAFCSDPV